MRSPSTLFAALLALSCGMPASAVRPNVVLISMDTTRIDALSCYGRLAGLHPDAPALTTPNLDALARDGLRFEHMYANAPTTLSSHTSMLSGRDPHHHHIPRNGFPLHPNIRTLPQRLAEEGWDTIGVVGAKALESEMGIDRGFRVYDDDTPVLRTAMYQRRGDKVLGATFKALDERPQADQPLFLFVHFYDPHAPYESPKPWSEKWGPPDYSGLYEQTMQNRLAPLRKGIARGTAPPADIQRVNGMYQGEVAYMDSKIGLLLDGLKERGLLEDALVVVTADHGEMLHEQARFAYMHGNEVTDMTVHIPHIWRAYGDDVVINSGVEPRSADLSRLAATIERAVGLEPTMGRDFWELVRPGPVLDVDGWPERPTIPVFSEATRPHGKDQDRWNNATLYRSVRVGGDGLSASEHYKIPAQVSSGTDPGLRRLLSGLLREWDASAPAYRVEQMNDATTAALKALGYLDD